MNLKSVYILLIACGFFTSSSFSQKNDLPVTKVFKLAEEQYKSMIEAYPDNTKYPRSTKEDSVYLSPDYEWTSGFFGGSLWLLYQNSNNEFWKKQATRWTESLEGIKKRTNTHDLGFMVFIPFGNGYKVTKKPNYREVSLEAATTLSRRFNPTVGAIRSWDFKPYTYPVIVDNLMNLELLLWAFKQTGDSSFYNIVKSHADTDLKHRFRPDNSSYHVVDFDPSSGEVIARKTHQGLADSTCWARGQAWAIYGYTMLYRETKEKWYLDRAQQSADYFITEVKKIDDRIPYWDFDDPKIPNVPRDASAATIAASGMIELSQLSGNKKYFVEAEAMLRSLCSPAYLAKAGSNNFFILKHSTGNKPSDSEIDVPLIYADYYFLEALGRYKNVVKNKL